jgi:hypothetical protein
MLKISLIFLVQKIIQDPNLLKIILIDIFFRLQNFLILVFIVKEDLMQVLAHLAERLLVLLCVQCFHKSADLAQSDFDRFFYKLAIAYCS